ncbi:hypothetical protein KVE69_07415 [Helicobacter pylori]|uniref:hypothetical protein n=1 Tax=Helicobacter pylori TaxID=210 RepID=UPI0001F47231|nr:hypothetical protein [Helicobacter pylori]WRC20714.1 hypothetical protein KVE69_07415 [Helicobacter pylori]BAJ60543.1 hypothetical protein HPF57_1469 [Helicobacter pylori F57]
MPYRLEKDFQDLIANNIQKDICSVLDYKDFKLLREDTCINGITAVFTLFERNKVRAIIECKSGAIGVSEYVRGIGQIFQYEYFFENHLSLKNYGFCQNFDSVLVFPESVLISGIIIFAAVFTLVCFYACLNSLCLFLIASAT